MERKDMKLGFIGFGNMAQAIAEGCAFKGTGAGADLRLCEGLGQAVRRNAALGHASLPGRLGGGGGRRWSSWRKAAPDRGGASPVRQLADEEFVSVAAGWPFERYEALLPGTRHLSTMPTRRCACARACSCWRKHSLTPEEYVLVQELFGHLGLVQPWRAACWALQAH